MRARALAPWIALGIVLAVALVVMVARSQPDDSPASRASRLEAQLKCPDCQGESIANSNTQTAIAMRQQVRSMTDAGRSDAQIRAYFVAKYPDILLSPSHHGIDLVIWLAPVLALLAGLAAIGVAIRRAQRRPRLEATPEDEQLVARARARAHPGEAGG